MIYIKAEERGCDKWGCGDFGASRGSRTHKGIDFKANPGQVLLASVEGEVSKIGYPYSDDLSYRYVQVTTKEGLDVRYFYVEPIVRLGDRVNLLDQLGTVQDLGKRYEDMVNHVHIEIKKRGDYIDPKIYFT